jgi:hypothetical protein
MAMLRAAVWGVTGVAGFLHAWAERFWLSPDAINYLDIASAYLRGDWKNAVNAYWSPFFSWILAVALGVVKPNPARETTVLHLVNFVGLLAALWAFEFFFRSYLQVRRKNGIENAGEEALSEIGYWTLGYGVFCSTCFFILTAPSTTTPDVWVCGLTFVAVGLLLKIRERGGGWGLFALLGLVLGLAYLTKAVYFPLSFVFLAAAWVAAGRSWKQLKFAAAAVVVFGLFAGPWIAAISQAKGRWTFGDVGKIAYAVTVDGIQQPAFWQGENGTGVPKHPTREISSHPRIYEFATPVGGTYPASHDWSYWMDGIAPRFSLRGHLRVLRQSLGTFYWVALTQVEYAMGLAIFLFLSRGGSGWTGGLLRERYIWGPALIACGFYVVLLVEGRYVAPFLPVIWIAVFGSALGSLREVSPRMAMAVILGAVLMTGLRVAKLVETDLIAAAGPMRNVDSEVARGLEMQGLRAGERIAILGDVGEVEWAREAGVRIVSEMPLGEERTFWGGDAIERQRVFQVFADTGARVVVTKDVPPEAGREGWVRLGETSFFGHLLN